MSFLNPNQPNGYTGKRRQRRLRHATKETRIPKVTGQKQQG
jgi:hypothetical protein